MPLIYGVITAFYSYCSLAANRGQTIACSNDDSFVIDLQYDNRAQLYKVGNIALGYGTLPYQPLLQDTNANTLLSHINQGYQYVEPGVGVTKALWIPFIFDRCHRSWAAMTPVKFECGIQ